MYAAADMAPVLGPASWAWRGLGFLTSVAAVTVLLVLVAG